MMSKKRIVIVALCLGAIILAVVVFKQFRTSGPPSKGINKKEVHKEAQDEHKGEKGHEDEKLVHISETEMKEFNIEIGTAGPGKIETQITLPGEVVNNADRLVHVVPRVPGAVLAVHKNLGDAVRTGEVLAVLKSRELADAKAAFLSALEREKLAKANFIREEDLWKKKISAEQDYLEARRALAEALIEHRSTEQKLHAIGLSDEDLARLPDQPEIDFTKYVLMAPSSGTIIKKHIVLGEVIKDDTEAFLIADLSSVWVNISVYQKDMPSIRKGQTVVISAGHEIPDTKGVISYIDPLVDEKTRTGLARVVLPNHDGHWRSGLFINARIAANVKDVPVAVPTTALQTIEDKTHVFVKKGEGFEPRPVTVGRADDKRVEIISGLVPGERYVAKGAFALKAELSKGELGEGHAH